MGLVRKQCIKVSCTLETFTYRSFNSDTGYTLTFIVIILSSI